MCSSHQAEVANNSLSTLSHLPTSRFWPSWWVHTLHSHVITKFLHIQPLTHTNTTHTHTHTLRDSRTMTPTNFTHEASSIPAISSHWRIRSHKPLAKREKVLCDERPTQDTGTHSETWLTGCYSLWWQGCALRLEQQTIPFNDVVQGPIEHGAGFRGHPVHPTTTPIHYRKQRT